MMNVVASIQKLRVFGEHYFKTKVDSLGDLFAVRRRFATFCEQSPAREYRVVCNTHLR